MNMIIPEGCIFQKVTFFEVVEMNENWFITNLDLNTQKPNKYLFLSLITFWETTIF